MDCPLLLTLAIPTYNRLACLKLLVGAVISQTLAPSILGRTTELVVCNNASTDGTKSYLTEIENTPGIRVIHHDTNCGAEKNIIHCCQAAKGKYVWIMGDDDVPLVGAIQSVIECLERNTPDLLYLPARWISGDLSQHAKGRIRGKSTSSLNSIGLAVRSSVFVTFISSWVMNMDAYKSYARPPWIDRYQGTTLPHMEWILTLLANGCKLHCADEEWILARGANSGGYEVFEVFSLYYNRIIDEKVSTNVQLHDFLKRCMLLCFIPGLVWGVRRNKIGSFGDFDREHVVSVLRAAYRNNIFAMLVVVPIARFYLPVAWTFTIAARVIAKLWLSLRRKQAAAGNRSGG